QAADADRVRDELESLGDVRATHEAAIDPDFGFSFYRLDDFGQHRGRAQAVVELPSAVVGNVDDLDAVLHGDLGVLDGRDAFDDERNVMLVFEALHLVPRQPRLESD